MKKYFVMILCSLILVACAQESTISADNVNQGLLLKDNEPFVLTETEIASVVEMVRSISYEDMDICKCIPEPYTETVQNRMNGNAIFITFTEPVSVQVPQKGETIQISKVLLDAGGESSLLGYEINGKFMLYTYGNEMMEEIQKISGNY